MNEAVRLGTKEEKEKGGGTHIRSAGWLLGSYTVFENGDHQTGPRHTY